MTAFADSNHGQNQSILRIHFEHEFDIPAVVEYEQLVMVGASTLLEFTTPFKMVDYGVAPDTIKIKRLLSQESLEQELINLGRRFQCRYVLYGQVDPKTTEHHELHGLHTQINLYDTVAQRHTFQTDYRFNVFKDKQPTLQQFTPDWEALFQQIKWLTYQIVGSLAPEHAFDIYKNVDVFELCHSLKDYKVLYKVHKHPPSRHALSALVKLAQRTPQLALAHYELATQLKQHRYYKHAFIAFQNAWQLFQGLNEEKKSFCATEAGVCLALMGEKEKALQWWNSAIQINPTNITPYINLAFSLEEAGHFDKAEQYLIQALDVDNSDIRIYGNLARVYSKQDQWDKAADIYKMLIRIEPDDPWHHSNLANCFLQLGQLDNAMTYLRTTVALDSSGEAGRCAAMILEGLEATAELVNAEY